MTYIIVQKAILSLYISQVGRNWVPLETLPQTEMSLYILENVFGDFYI